MTPPLREPSTPDRDPLAPALLLAAAVHAGDAEGMRRAAPACDAALGAGRAREVLRLLHLFLGFPPLVRAWNVCAPVCDEDPNGPGPDPPTGPVRPDGATADARARGEATFRALYGEDAAPVLAHLAGLDPTFRDWILEHAYGRVLARGRLDVPAQERVALVCLAATGCWKQWDSHAAIALRHGVSSARLAADLALLADRLDAATLAEARRRLAALTGDPPGAPR